jgi:thioredoxin-related protein
MKRLIAAAMAVLLLALPVQAVEMGDDGLHKPDWLHETFREMSDDLADAQAEGKRLMVIFEQRGCAYCKKMHTEVFTDPEIEAMLRDDFFVVQMNLFGDVEVTDFDGLVLPEKQMAVRWGVVFTPTMVFLPDSDPGAVPAGQAAVITVPGAFSANTTRDLLTYVLENGYDTDEHFQKYHARKIEERGAGVPQ